MKSADYVMILLGVAGLGLGVFAVVKASRQPALVQGPIAAAQPAPVGTATVPKTPPAPTPVDDVKKTVGDIFAFVEGLGSTVDSLGKFFDRF